MNLQSLLHRETSLDSRRLCYQAGSGSEHEVHIVSNPQADGEFACFDHVLDAQAGIARLRLVFALPARLVRVRTVELYCNLDGPLPLWRCSAETSFHGVIEPEAAHQWRLGQSLLVLGNGQGSQLVIVPDPLPAVPRLLRLVLSVDRVVSDSLVQELGAFFRRQLEEQSRSMALREAEARRLVELIHLPRDDPPETCRQREAECDKLRELLIAKDAALASLQNQLDELQSSTSWRITAPFRLGKRWLAGTIRQLTGGAAK
jgi:hypothetical protein